ncbi:M96 mating-specific protein family [Phytophthora infestans T30-4]|uniref:M96 mating-specific protein family n=1 Tax=Phytophthora infestans (strain T30-4) TaxID=403677 RepID=D0N4J6_PHYIT|nr:M96 mating-specific protein family [Phytophthora infestans T30-4]EEY69804.1 M96 mating-specific protein family [Phytophthora infestans T30-4]|eukprot:XP_002998451.1 M96 mating-specific protein family [Phytophthora infestans T30-4]
MKLKMQYENEKQLVKSLEKMLHKRHVPANDTEPQATKQTRRTDIPDGHNGLLDEGKKLKGIERKFYDRRTMPFGMRSTGDAWWENWHNYRGQRFQDIAANEITESFGLEMSDFKTNVSATAYSQQISQRHVEDKRIVFVWDAYVEPFGFANERVSGVYLLEQNYVLIEPEFWSSERTRGRSNGSATRVSTCYVITPYFLDPKLKDDPKTMAVINFLVSALSTNIMALSEMVETLLLDQVLQR